MSYLSVLISAKVVCYSMERKHYVNGLMLGENIGQSVCVVGKILSNIISRNEIVMEMCDGVEVNVTFDREQMKEPIYGYIQMVAMVSNINSLVVEDFVCLDGEIDLEIYNKAIGVAAQYPNLFSASRVDGGVM